MSLSGCFGKSFSLEYAIAVKVYANPRTNNNIPNKNNMLGFKLKSSTVINATFAAMEYFATKNLVKMY